MSDLSFLEMLMDGAEVKWKPLTAIAEYSTERISSQALDKTNYVGVDNLIQNRGGRVDSSYVPISGNLTHFQQGDILIGNIRPYLRKIWLADRTGGTNGDVLVVHPADEVVDPRYLHQVLTDEKFFHYNISHSKGAKMPRGSKSHILQYPVPIPCPDDPEKSLAIQREIVRILGTFTELTIELTAELAARKKQYEHYRKKLLACSLENDCDEMSIGEIYDFQYGQGNTIPTVGGDYPVYGSNGIVGTHHNFNSEDSPVIGHIGAYAGIVNWGKGKHFVTYNGVICRHKSEKVLPKYAYYLLLLQDYGSKSNSASQPFVSYHILEAPKVVIPSLEEQARIVSILDKFETLTSSLSEGLPREIALRQQQYEYYSDLLLSFPKPKEAVEA